jgi:2-polyprenyl-6-methoxyphenol hydroxylase-like FAD-dependent oxidoreductase
MGRHVHVAVIGGGPGGLTLAQGLRRHGIDVAVFEKSRVRDDYVQGFRMRIRQRGLDALEACLPADLHEAFLATLGRAPTESLLFDDQLRPIDEGGHLSGGQEDDTHLEKSVSRITLRQVLLTGLEDVLEIGRVFERYEENVDGTVTVFFEDGGQLSCDLLVGADGASSRVRAQLLPHAATIDTGARRLAGKMTLDAARHFGIPQAFIDYNVRIKSAQGPGLMIASHIVDRQAYTRYGMIGTDDDTHRDIAGFHFDNSTSYLWWNTAYPKDGLASDDALRALDGPGFIALLVERTRGWHPDIVKLIAHSEPSTVQLLRVRSSVPVEPWQTGRVTLLGDAIHSMTYFRALGGNSAIYDAGLLVQALAGKARSRRGLIEAVARYEAAMLEHGFDAVRGSLSAMNRSLQPLAA